MAAPHINISSCVGKKDMLQGVSDKRTTWRTKISWEASSETVELAWGRAQPAAKKKKCIKNAQNLIKCLRVCMKRGEVKRELNA